MTATAPMLELTDLILEFGGSDLHNCMQCATCSGVCPWNLVKDYSPRTIIRQASLGLEGYEQEALWNCVTCNTCVINCPRGIDIIDVLRSTRAVMVEAGTLPPTFAGPLGSLRTDGNPWSGDRSNRYKWAEGLNLPTFSENNDYLFYTCCTQAYDPRNTKVARALISVLKGCDVNFGVLGNNESCCGDQARKTGAEDIYSHLKDSNLDLFGEHSVEKIITSSPHCMQVINTDYAKSIPVQAIHYTQLFEKLIKENKLVPTEPIERTVTYHDPCYLGRHAGVYDVPRNVLRSIPGLELVEMPRNRENSLCCGGGGGGLWMDLPMEERFSVLRIQEALDSGASVIATACPYCTSMLEDAIKILDVEEKISVMDVAELVAQSLSKTGI